MKIRAITPMHVGHEEIIRRQHRYERLAPENWQIALEDLPEDVGVPIQLGDQRDLDASERLTIKAGVTTDPALFDAVMPDCVLDPGLAELDARADLPALGITRLGSRFLGALGVRFGVITRNTVIGNEYARVIKGYGLGELFRGVYVLNLSVEDISRDEVWNAAVELAAQKAASDGVTVLFNGCSAVEVTFQDADVRIIDPTALALRVAELGAAQGLL